MRVGMRGEVWRPWRASARAVGAGSEERRIEVCVAGNEPESDVNVERLRR